MTQHIEKLKQRAEYTHKFNSTSGRHGWLRLTPAYSLKVVEEILENHRKAERVLDPFCGTGTTALSAVARGSNAVTTDINPFLVWLAGVKTKRYSSEEICGARKDVANALALVREGACYADPPPIYKIERWWGPACLDFLCRLRTAIDAVSSEPVHSDLLKIAFCRTLIKLSNAAFNHQSMSFKPDTPMLDLDFDYSGLYSADCEHIFNGALVNLKGNSRACLCDARELCQATLGTFDLVITSPPYANRMSYIRELRPYMYWLGYIVEARDAGELDWKAIGGTWGIATSRLGEWKSRHGFQHTHLSEVSRTIRSGKNKNGMLLGNYVDKYFDDMFGHFRSLKSVMRPGGMLHYIIGNSTFYGVLVKTEEIYGDMLRANDFVDVEVRPIRKRNSKKELIEYAVSAMAR